MSATIPKAADLADLLASTGPASAAKPFRLATIPSTFVLGAGRPPVIFDGETTATTRLYPCVQSYSPAPSDRVVMAPVGKSYVILGAIALTNMGGLSTYSDIEIYTPGRGVIMHSPNGSRWRLTPSDSGATVWTSV